MSDPGGIEIPFEPAGAKRLLDQFAVSQAADLALSGDYSSAEALLKDLVQQPEASAEALDLMAKIYAQQGRVAEAGQLWRRALERDPANSAYQAALVRLNRLQQRPVWAANIWPAALAFGLFVLFLVTIEIQSARRRTELADFEAMAKQNSDSAAKTSEEIDRLSQSLDAMKVQQAVDQKQLEQARHDIQGLARASAVITKTSNQILAALSRRSTSELQPSEGPGVAREAQNSVIATGSPSELDLQITGIVATRQRDRWVIRFNNGLFDGSGELTNSSKGILKSIAKKLAQNQEKLTVEIVGQSEIEPSTSPRSEPETRDAVSLARAEKVQHFLNGLGLFPADSLRTTAVGSGGLASPTDTVAISARNRTVLLIVPYTSQEKRQQ